MLKNACVGLLALIVLVLPMAASAQCVPFDGLNYCPKGQATVQGSAQGVAVSGLSRSGADGVSVDLSKSGPAASVGNRILLGDESGTGAGYVQVAARGLINGELGTIIRTTLWAAGGSLYVSNDYPDMPDGDGVIAVVANDQIVGLFQNLGEGASVRFRAPGGQLRNLRGEPGLGSLPAPLANAVSDLDVDLICPDDDPWDLWNLCQVVPCTGGDIALINNNGGEVTVDVLDRAGAVLGTFESATVLITRTGGNAPRSPFLTETVTGAGFDGFLIQETRIFEPMR
jgi:hypothetical protein